MPSNALMAACTLGRPKTCGSDGCSIHRAKAGVGQNRIRHNELLIGKNSPSRQAAVEREKWLKTGFGRKWLKKEIATRTQTGDPVRAKMAGRDTGLPSDVADLFPRPARGLRVGADSGRMGDRPSPRNLGLQRRPRYKKLAIHELGKRYPIYQHPLYSGRRPSLEHCQQN